jgi:hypothetical protein
VTTQIHVWSAFQAVSLAVDADWHVIWPICSLFVLSPLSVYILFFFLYPLLFSCFFFMFSLSVVLDGSQYHGWVFPMLFNLWQKLNTEASGSICLYCRETDEVSGYIVIDKLLDCMLLSLHGSWISGRVVTVAIHTSIRWVPGWNPEYMLYWFWYQRTDQTGPITSIEFSSNLTY